MFWHLLLILFSPLATLCVGVLGDDRGREILALRQQVANQALDLAILKEAAAGNF